MIKLGPNMPTMRYKNHPHPLAEPQRIPVRENNEYWADVWSIPHWKPNLLQHLELSHRMQFFEVMMDTRGSLFPWAHHLLICKDDLKSSLQLIKAFVLFHLGSGGCVWVSLSASIYGPWCLRSWKCLCSLLATLFEVSRSQINKRLLWSGVRSGGGRWDAPCPLWNPALPSCQATTWCLARCLVHIPFPGKGANKTSCRSALPRVFVFHQETPLARKSRSCKILPESTWYIPFNLCCPAWNTEKRGVGREVI